MRAINEKVFSRLSTDPVLVGLLAPGDFGEPAIFDVWGQQAEGPYIILTWLPFQVVGDDLMAGTLQLDIFDRSAEQGGGSYGRVLDVRDQVIRLLDGWRDLNGVDNLRMYATTERRQPEESGRLRRYVIDFEARFNRTRDIGA